MVDPEPPHLTRRQLLTAAAALAAGGVFAACTDITRNPLDALPVSSDEFLTLSRVLTGTSALDPTLAATYLEALRQTPGFDAALSRLYNRAGFRTATPPARVADLDGLLSDQGLRGAADAITSAWFTGTVPSGSGVRVVTYIEALAYTTLGFTKPPSECGGDVGYWRSAP